MKHIHYSNEQIERLSKDIRIKHIDQNSIRFTHEYRLSIYERIKDNISAASIRNILLEDGFDLSDIDSQKNLVHNLAKTMNFRKPCGSKNIKIHDYWQSMSTDKSYNQFLLDSRKFVKKGKGVSFSEDYKSDIYHSYPEISIEAYLINDGFDISRIGYQRIYKLINEFNGSSSSSSSYEDDVVKQLKSNSYIKTITNKKLTLHSQFYKDAYHLSSIHIDDILEIFEIDYSSISVSTKKRIEYRLKNKFIITSQDIKINEQYVRIQKNISEALNILVECNFTDIKSKSKNFNWIQRKDAIDLINELFNLEGNPYSITQLCKKCGVSRSSYYSILNNESYGESSRIKDQEDEQYIQIIKNIIDYKSYPKGSRMIYMMQDNFGMHISRNKIIKLRRKEGIVCEVRKGNKSRQAANELLKRNVKPNLIKRRFRLDKPNKLILSDVTYVKYDRRNQTAYLSDVKDAVTGKSICHVLSKNNDLNLVLNTVKQLPPALDGAIFHSDQGVLYLNDLFQLKIAELGYKQSMSKRGNCWDNAPKESQFGHMKDENIFNDIQTFEKLKVVIDEYYVYYNTERPQWTRNKMTPVEYEKYLNSLSDEEYEEYIMTETKKYDTMMVNAANKAMKRANDLKAL